jgi:hypothetical protein
MAEVAGARITRKVEVVTEVPRGHDSKRADRGEGAVLTAVEFVGAPTHAHKFPLGASRKVKILHRHVSGVTGRLVAFAGGGVSPPAATGFGPAVVPIARIEVARIHVAHGSSFNDGSR